MTNNELEQTLAELRSLPAETEFVEFKKARNSFDLNELGKYFSGLSNEANLNNKSCAWLVFGVEDKTHAIIGSQYCQGNRKALDDLKQYIAQDTTGGITFTGIYELNLPEGRVIMFQIPAALRGVPTDWKWQGYARNGESLMPLSDEKRDRIRAQSAHTDWSAVICPQATLADLDTEAITKARDNYKVKNPKLAAEVDGWNDIIFLNKARLTIDGKITRTAILLLGKPEAEHHISPATSRITWTLYDAQQLATKDYEHFDCPLLLAIDKVFNKIRNLKYRYIKDGALFPDEVDQYEASSIREALNNCIAHQDYTLGGRITVTERTDDMLSFTNLGGFLPGTVDAVLHSKCPPSYYRNPFLAAAMVNLNMIDTVGSGIPRMFSNQRKRFFPLPDYELGTDPTGNKMVNVTLTGKVLDVNYAKALARNKELSLDDIILLDKVQKKKTLTPEERKYLKSKGLIEGRKPNEIIAEHIAVGAGQVAEYINNRGLDDDYYKKMILELIQTNKRKKARTVKKNINSLLWNKLPQILNDSQKQSRINNILTTMKKEGKIKNKGGRKYSEWDTIS